MVTTVRQVGVWYYLLTSLLFILALRWMSKRNLSKFGWIVLTTGASLNLLWELALFFIWERRYVSPFPVVVQGAYQSLTEFGPLFLLILLLLDWRDVLSLDPWRESHQSRLSVRTARGANLLFVLWVLCLVGGSIVSPLFLLEPVQVIRKVSMSFFITEATIAVSVLGLSFFLRNRTAIKLFFLLGLLNISVEIVGLLTGVRTYQGIASLASVIIGFGEGGAAAALTWLTATNIFSYLDKPSHHSINDR